MFGWILVTMVTAAVLGSSRAGVNLLKDGDFEAPSSLHSWSCGSCSFSLVSDSHSGRHSVKVQHRQAMWSGPAQTFPVRPGQKFFFRGYIKLLNKSPDKLYHNVKVKLDFIDPTGNGQPGFQPNGSIFIGRGDEGNCQGRMRLVGHSRHCPQME